MRAPPSREQPRSVTILGATGSIGASTLSLIADAPDLFAVEAVTAFTSAHQLASIARSVGARLAVVGDPAAYTALREALSGTGIVAAAGAEALVEAAERPADLVMGAIVGAAGLHPVLAAARRGALVALANKECLVCAGTLLMQEVRRSGAVLLPVDSEHSAIFQALAGSRRGDVERVTLTASGGPFRTASPGEMARATPTEAIRHPNWSMGAKISVDSATMMNKGLEIIEAHHLFALPEPQIEVVIHPQSAVHSLVTFKDGSTLAQLGAADMRVPIAYALGWPARLASRAPRLDLLGCGRLDFTAPDPDRFPALDLARAALRRGGAAPTILNAANEIAVAAFMEGRIGFLQIAETVADVLARMPPMPVGSVEDVLACDREARNNAHASIARSGFRGAALTRRKAPA